MLLLDKERNDRERAESWVIDNPILSNAVFPTCVVLGGIDLNDGDDIFY